MGLVRVHKRQQVLPGCDDKTQTCWVIQAAPRCDTGLGGGGGCPLAQSAGMHLGARLLERGWIYGLSTKVLEFPKVATAFSLLPTIRGGCLGGGKLFLRASSCAGNSQQQANDSVRLLPVLCLLLICLPSLPGRLWVLHCLLLVQQSLCSPCTVAAVHGG